MGWTPSGSSINSPASRKLHNARLLQLAASISPHREPSSHPGPKPPDLLHQTGPLLPLSHSPQTSMCGLSSSSQHTLTQAHSHRHKNDPCFHTLLTHTYSHVHAYTHSHTLIFTHTHTLSPTHTHRHKKHTYVHMLPHTNTPFLHMCAHVHTNSRGHTCSPTHTRTYSHTYPNIQTQREHI